MKILLATPIYPPEIGGPATYSIELCERLGKDHSITVLAYSDDGVAPAGVTLVRVSKHLPLPIRILSYTYTLWRVAKEYDVIYAQNAVAAGFPAAVVGKLRDIPVVIKFVGDEAWERSSQSKQTTLTLEEFLEHPPRISLYVSLLRHIQGWSLRHATIVTTPSAYLAKAIMRAYRLSAGSVVVNYNASELPESESVSIHPSHTLVATARLVEWKGIDGILRALLLLLPKFPDVRLSIAGDGPEEKNLKQLTRELRLEGHVKFHGKLTRDETRSLRRESRVYVLNSFYEGLPHTVLSSFSAGIPTIATDVSGTNEAVAHEVNGLLVPAKDPVALAAAIERLFRDDELCARLVRGGYRTLREKFSWEAHIHTLCDIFSRCMKQG